MITVCPSEQDLDRYHAGELADTDGDAIRLHLEQCSSCAERDAALMAECEDLIASMRRLPSAEEPATWAGWLACAAHSDDAQGHEPLAGYRIVRRIRCGGQGTIYEAIQIGTHRRVAIKVVHQSDEDRAVSSRIAREAQILAQLRHPNIVAVHDSGATAGDVWFVMDFIEGQRLDEFLREGLTARTGARKDSRTSHLSEGRLSTREVISLFRTICGAVGAAHLLGIVHRDLKPANILVDPVGEPRILDFGLARTGGGPGSSSGPDLTLTQSGQFLGTLAWASPEQAEGGEIDPRADVYALGVMLYHALTGVFPYATDGSVRDTIDNICHRTPPRPSRIRAARDDELDAIVLTCLAKEPARRYASATELTADLDNYLNQRPVSVKGVSATYALRKAILRHKAFSGVSIGAILCVISLAVVMTGASIRLQHERDVARDARQTAQEQRDLAKEEAVRLRQTGYYQQIALAQRAYETYQTDQMQSSLNGCPADLRAWEWYRLSYLADESAGNTTFDWVIRSEPGYLSRTRSAGSDCPILSAKVGLYAICEHGEILIRSLVDHHVFRRITGNTTGVVWHAFSPDGQELAWIQLGAYKIELASLDEKATARRELTLGCQPTSCDYSNDGEVMAITCGTGEVVLHARGRQQPDQQITKLTRGAFSARFSPDDRFLGVGCDDGNIYIYEAQTGRQASVLQGHRGSVFSVSWSPDQARLVSGGADETVRVWDVARRECTRILRGHTDPVRFAAFHEDGQRIVSHGNRWTKTWDLRSRHEVREFGQPNQYHFGGGNFSPDGHRVAVGCSDGNTRIFDTTKDIPGVVDSWQTARDNGNASLFSPDGTKLLTTGTDCYVHLWDAKTHAELQRFAGHIGGVPCACFSADGKQVLTGGWDHTARLWDVDKGNQRLAVRHSEEIWEVAFTPDGQSFVAGGKDGTLIAWSAGDGRVLWSQRAHDRAIDALAVSPDGRLIATGGWDNRLIIWDGKTHLPVHLKRTQEDNVYCAAFTPDGRRLLTSGSRLIEVWDPVTGERVYTVEAHATSIYSLAFSPDGRTLCSCGADGILKVWPVAGP